MSNFNNIHFFIGQLRIGGIETYLCRIAKELSGCNILVFVWVVKNSKDEELYINLKKYATVNFIGNFNRLSIVYVKPITLPKDTDFVVAMGQTALTFAMRACAKLNRPVKLVIGVFSQWEFISTLDVYRNRVTNNMFERLTPNNVFFCTEGCRNYHTKVYKKSIDSKVSPLLIDLDKFTTTKASENVVDKSILKIISVGRITPFKTYNYQMPHIMKSLVNKGFNVQWDVYGDGVGMRDLKRIIIETDMSSHITLHGMLPYSELPEKFNAADIFVGAGTSIIESSSAGLPAIVALDDIDEPMSPGFFCDREGVFTSDTKAGEVLYEIEGMLEGFLKLTYQKRINLSQRSIAKADLYSTKKALSEYEEIYKNARSIKVKMPFSFVFYDIFSLIKYFLVNKAMPVRDTHN